MVVAKEGTNKKGGATLSSASLAYKVTALEFIARKRMVVTLLSV